jgi:hypothetical protein
MKRIKTVVITKDQVQEVINKIPFTAFFGCTFVKANGKLRKMNCNKAISIGLKTKKVPTTITSSMITVYDRNAVGFRKVNLDTVSEIRTNRTIYKVTN